MTWVHREGHLVPVPDWLGPMMSCCGGEGVRRRKEEEEEGARGTELDSAKGGHGPDPEKRSIFGHSSIPSHPPNSNL